MNVLPVELRAADDGIDGMARDALAPRSRRRKEHAVSKREMLGIVALLAIARRQRTDLFSFVAPDCPVSSQLSALACPRYLP